MNYVKYEAKSAMNELNQACGFEYYGDKHCESIFTRFMQRYYLPEKFHVDKRKSHYSSMILSKQITREEALRRLEEPLYNDEDLEKDISYILEQLGMTRTEFEQIMEEPPRSHDDFKKSSFNKMIHFILKFRKY